MIQDIHPNIYDINYFQAIPGPRDIITYFSEDRLLLRKDPEKEVYFLPTMEEFRKLIEAVPEDLIVDYERLFSINEDHVFLLEETAAIDEAVDGASDFILEEVAMIREYENQWMAFAGITARHLYRWKRNNRFCGRCGSHMRQGESDRGMFCDNCGNIQYPKISPAIITAVTSGDRLLMARASKGSYKRWSLIAGFVEVGETFEDTVRREVMEEVGIRVKNIRYFKSQPWGFSDSIMIGFFAELEGSDMLTLQEEEISEADWFSREDIPETPSSVSIAAEMIEAFRNGQERI